MIASQKIGKSFTGALRYNMKKLFDTRQDKRAELLATNFSSVNAKEIGREVEWLRQLRPNLNRYVYHTSLNFSATEAASLNNEKLLAIGQDYLQAMGYTSNQFLIFRHHDAEHPHLHLLANRICFDGSVVSDSNNYEKSEAVVRRLEKQYGLTAVEGSKQATDRAPKKDEIEMSLRTRHPSTKMLLQQLLSGLLQDSGTGNRKLSFAAFIRQGEALGIHFIFNQASTGRVTGITYQYQDFKVTGKALGNRYKWGELIKQLDYEQERDHRSVSQRNGRTAATAERAAAAVITAGTGSPGSGRTGKPGTGTADQYALPDAAELAGKPQTDRRTGEQPAGTFTGDDAAEAGRSGSATGAAQWSADDYPLPGCVDRADSDDDFSPGLQIADDEDDALKRRRKRRSR